ncbi:Nuclease SbcCD subunit D [compost metagenome]
MHKPQKVNREERIRYSGSPIPLSFAEINYPHQVLEVELDGAELVSVEPRPVPRAVALQRMGPAPLAELLELLAELPVIDLLEDPNRQPWLEVRVRLDEPQPDLRQQIETALQGKAVRLVRISAEYAGRGTLEEDELEFVELSQMTPQDLFSRAWEQAYGNPVDEQALSDFAQLLQDVQLEQEQP